MIIYLCFITHFSGFRFSDYQRDKPLKSNWKQKMEIRAKHKVTKLHEKELKESRINEKQVSWKFLSANHPRF